MSGGASPGGRAAGAGSAAAQLPPLKIAFFMSRAMGHGTQYLNWRRVVDALPERVAPSWFPVVSGVTQPLLRKLPLPETLRRTASEWLTIRQGLAGGEYDAVFLNPHNLAVKHRRVLARRPMFLSLDSTRKQWESFRQWYKPAPTEKGLLGSLRVQRQKRNLQSAAAIFPVSDWAAGSLVEDYGVDPQRVHTIPVGVDTALWQPAAEKPRDGITRILFIGRQLVPKGGDLVLKWAQATAQRDWELHMVTETPGAPAPNVTFHQATSNAKGLVELVQRCDLFVLPTRADCSSIALIEAMATGMPGIVSAVGGIPELVQEGETGWVVPRDDYDALHQRLEAALAQRERLPEMGRVARARTLVEYDSSNNVRRALGIIEAACGRPPAAQPSAPPAPGATAPAPPAPEPR